MAARVAIAVSVSCAAWRRAPAGAKALARAAAEAALAAVRRAGGTVPRAGELSLVLADDALARRLNRDYRRKDAPTNVLAFPASAPGERAAERGGAPRLLGDVIVAWETSRSEAAALGKPLAHHLAHLVVHGTLHLLGYDHARPAEALRMERLERAALAGLGIPDPYAAERRRHG